MKLKLFEAPTIEAVKAETLDQLWHEASQLGGVRVFQYEKGHSCDCTIKFKRPSGTTVEAIGKDTSIHVALAKAINEAREMGAA